MGTFGVLLEREGVEPSCRTKGQKRTEVTKFALYLSCYTHIILYTLSSEPPLEEAPSRRSVNSY